MISKQYTLAQKGEAPNPAFMSPLESYAFQPAPHAARYVLKSRSRL